MKYLSVAMTLFFAALWWVVDPLIFSNLLDTSPFVVLLVIVFLVPIHELLHAAIYPLGNRREILFGYWPEMFVFYASYQGRLSRNRWLLVYVFPFVVLSFVPLLIVLFFSVPPWLAVSSIINAGASVGDLVAVAMILRQVPSQSVIVQNGWDTFWQRMT
ncbi:hypothetical protein BST95_13245 [Halioglobus japonicus]|nr:hypothetical protein BST95_13245 [Halioglobus japonicus]